MNAEQIEAIGAAMAEATRAYVEKRIAEMQLTFAAEVAKAIPVAPDVDAIVKEAIAGLPQAQEVDLSEAVAEASAAALEAVSRAVAEIPKARDGQDGKDALEVEIIPAIHATRSYQRGTWAQHEGGIWRAVRDTDPLDGDAAKAGWAVLVRGVQDIEVHQIADGVIAVKTKLTGGVDSITKVDMGGLYYKEVWTEQEYQKNASVTWGGSLWVATKATSEKPGVDDSWTLAAKRGRDAKPVKQGE